MSSNDKDCCDLTPTDDCNKTCCPDYEPDSDWCKAFNKRTLEQQRESTKVMENGMWFNIEDAKNTINQAEQYLAMIYEMLCAALDQVMKVSSTAGRTVGDFDSASMRVQELVQEIDKLADAAQYNGRYLLQKDKKSDADQAGDGSEPTDNNAKKRTSIKFRLAGARGFCRNLNASFNDFTFELAPAGAAALGLNGNTDSAIGNVAHAVSSNSTHVQNYWAHGLKTPTYGWDNDGLDAGDANDDNVDATISDFNCAIKSIGVQLDKMRAYRYILCLREKQIRIWKNGQNKCFEHKCKI